MNHRLKRGEAKGRVLGKTTALYHEQCALSLIFSPDYESHVVKRGGGAVGSLVDSGSADLGEDILLHRLVVLVHDVQEPDAIASAVGKYAGDVEIPKSGDQLPLSIVEFP